LAVLVDESVAGGVSLDRSAGPILDDFGSIRCALPKSAVRAVRVVVRYVVVEELLEVSVVPDEVRSQSSRRMVPTHRSA
jgi:hypothetical protein